eukprot:TRINITY_DN10532_c0_g1_i1.p3 TRINITY_DN10532_c0_g1~~TRINITY_DN10532_c0_g1_i1.p3  ORF type:complete len:108 (+),score=27.21 TRINITY_DN10532_c0_g1_i1:108-431(+)
MCIRDRRRPQIQDEKRKITKSCQQEKQEKIREKQTKSVQRGERVIQLDNEAIKIGMKKKNIKKKQQVRKIKNEKREAKKAYKKLSSKRDEQVKACLLYTSPSPRDQA